MSKKQKKVKVYREHCTNWTRYKAMRAPTCGCRACNYKWQTKLLLERECSQLLIKDGQWKPCKNKAKCRTIECSIGYENDKNIYVCDSCWKDMNGGK